MLDVDEEEARNSNMDYSWKFSVIRTFTYWHPLNEAEGDQNAQPRGFKAYSYWVSGWYFLDVRAYISFVNLSFASIWVMQSYLTENVIVMTIVTFAYFMTAFHEGLHFSWLPHIYLWISQIVTFFISILLFSLIPPYAWFNATVIQSWKIHGYDYYSWTHFYFHISSRFKQSSFFRHLVEEFRTASSNHNWFLIDSLLDACRLRHSRVENLKLNRKLSYLLCCGGVGHLHSCWYSIS